MNQILFITHSLTGLQRTNAIFEPKIPDKSKKEPTGQIMCNNLLNCRFFSVLVYIVIIVWCESSYMISLNFNPLLPRVLNIGRLTKISISIKEGIIKKNFLWASRLWVGRRLEPILGYVPKNDETNNLVHKGLKKMKFIKISLTIYCPAS